MGPIVGMQTTATLHRDAPSQGRRSSRRCVQAQVPRALVTLCVACARVSATTRISVSRERARRQISNANLVVSKNSIGPARRPCGEGSARVGRALPAYDRPRPVEVGCWRLMNLPPKPLMGFLPVVVRQVLADARRADGLSPRGMSLPRHSRLMERTKRSGQALRLGLLAGRPAGQIGAGERAPCGKAIPRESLTRSMDARRDIPRGVWAGRAMPRVVVRSALVAGEAISWCPETRRSCFIPDFGDTNPTSTKAASGGQSGRGPVVVGGRDGQPAPHASVFGMPLPGRSASSRPEQGADARHQLRNAPRGSRNFGYHRCPRSYDAPLTVCVSNTPSLGLNDTSVHAHRLGRFVVAVVS